MTRIFEFEPELPRHHQTPQPSPSFAPVKSAASPGLFVSIVIEKLAGFRWLAREVQRQGLEKAAMTSATILRSSP